MFILIIIILVAIVFTYRKVGLNYGSIIGALIGAFLGGSLGVAGGGDAVNGTAIFAGIGFIIGGLIIKK